MTVNEEFETNETGIPDADVVAQMKAEKKAATAEKAAATRKANKEKKEAADAEKPDGKLAAATKPAEVKFIDPEMDRENWPTIIIEMEEGKPNYEFVTSHGTMKNNKPFGHELQIMRGVEVPVPPSIVESLQRTVATHFVPRRDPVTGRLNMERQDRSAIPWRLVKAGKYLS